MSRVEECSETIKVVNEVISSITDQCSEPGFNVQPSDFLMSGIEFAKITLMMDIAKSLAIIADKCDE